MPVPVIAQPRTQPDPPSRARSLCGFGAAVWEQPGALRSRMQETTLQETTFSVQFVPEMRFLPFDFAQSSEPSRENKTTYGAEPTVA
eukprot:1829306-Rhodomonas_salina.2